MTLSLLMTGLFIGTIFTPAIASDLSLTSDTADRYPGEQSSGLAENPFDPIDGPAAPEEEPVHESAEAEGQAEEEVCLPCQVEPLETGEMSEAEELMVEVVQEPGCDSCQEAVEIAWDYAIANTDFEFDIDPEDLEGMSLIEKILFLRSEWRKPFRNFAKHFGAKLWENSEALDFGIFEAIAGSGVVFTVEWIVLLISYGFQSLLITLEALNKVKEYVIDLCDGEEGDGQTVVQELPVTLLATTQQTATQTTVVETVAAGTTQTGVMSI